MEIDIRDGVLYGIKDIEPYYDDYLEIYKDKERNKYFIHFHNHINFHTIAPYAFANRDDIFGITIHVDHIKLSEGSFYNCQSLGLVVIFNMSNKDYEIPDYCFARCGINSMNYFERKLLIINLPYGIRKIGKGAFMNSGLSSFNHPENIVKNYYYVPLDYDKKLNNYSSSSSYNSAKFDYKGYYYTYPLFEFSAITENRYNGSSYNDDYFKVIEHYSFEAEDLFDFSRLIYIGQYAFYNCYGLTTATNFNNGNEKDVIDNKFFPLNADIIRFEVTNIYNTKDVITTVDHTRNYFQFPEGKTIDEVYNYGYKNTRSQYMNGDYGKYYDYIDSDLFTFDYNAKGSSGVSAHHNSGNKKLLYDNTTLELYRKLPSKDQAMNDTVFLPNPYSMYISYWCCDNLFECFNYCYGYLINHRYDFENEGLTYEDFNEDDKAIIIYPCKIKDETITVEKVLQNKKLDNGNTVKTTIPGDYPVNSNYSSIKNNAEDFFTFSHRRMYEDGIPNGSDYKITNYPDCETYYSCSLTMANELIRPDYRNTPYNIEEIRDLLKKHLMKKIVKPVIINNEEAKYYKGELIKKYKTLYWENFKETEY